MAKTFHLTIARVGKNLFDDEAVSASLPGTEGRFEILAEHEAFVSRLNEGEARVKVADGSILAFPIPQGSIAEVSHNQATVLL
jgi:F0F1-type ATP synthase epsilon subunit